jgi:large subunit ribosomal protein L18
MKRLEIKNKRRSRRKHHIRKNIFGTPDRLRLTVFKSLKHIYAQIINDVDGTTLATASTLDKEVIEKIKPDTKRLVQSKFVGALLAKRAEGKDIKKVAFDRNGSIYHGRIKALADAARKGGLDF